MNETSDEEISKFVEKTKEPSHIKIAHISFK